jgi:hypothetical protein
MGAIYYKALPHLGFNRHITTEFRTLPSSFQGIGLRHWSIEKLAKDITVLLRHWKSTTTLGQAFQLLYEAFQMEVGLDGNIFTQSFTDFGHLATHSWFKILWQYASQYQVQVIFHPQYQLLPTRSNDRPLITLFRLHNYIGPDLSSLCRTRKFYQVHSLADVICADGTTVDPKFVSGRQGSSSRVFSWEHNPPRLILHSGNLLFVVSLHLTSVSLLPLVPISASHMSLTNGLHRKMKNISTINSPQPGMTSSSYDMTEFAPAWEEDTTR